MTEPLAWINNRTVPFSEAAVPVWDLGVVAGAAVSELGRTFGHQPFQLDRHAARFTHSCGALGIPLRYTPETLIATAIDLVQSNCRLIPEQHDLGIVMFATAGANASYGWGGEPQHGTVAVHSFPLPLAAWRDAVIDGVRLRIPSTRQIPEDCLPVGHKIRNRMHWWLADREAARLEPGSRALLLDRHGGVTETSTSAFHAVIDGTVCTPDQGVLESLSSRLTEELCAAVDIPFTRRSVGRDELQHCTEAFLTSSASCLLPVRSIDGSATGAKVPGPITRKLQEAWSRRAGIDIVEQIRSGGESTSDPRT